VSIPFFDWDRLQRPEQMDAYVQQRLLQVPAQCVAGSEVPSPCTESLPRRG
jgi:hypothetical protein